MSKILQEAQAGTLESNVVIITVAPSEKGKGIVMDLRVSSWEQYGERWQNGYKCIEGTLYRRCIYLNCRPRSFGFIYIELVFEPHYPEVALVLRRGSLMRLRRTMQFIPGNTRNVGMVVALGLISVILDS